MKVSVHDVPTLCGSIFIHPLVRFDRVHMKSRVHPVKSPTKETFIIGGVMCIPNFPIFEKIWIITRSLLDVGDVSDCYTDVWHTNLPSYCVYSRHLSFWNNAQSTHTPLISPSIFACRCSSDAPSLRNQTDVTLMSVLDSCSHKSFSFLSFLFNLPQIYSDLSFLAFPYPFAITGGDDRSDRVQRGTSRRLHWKCQSGHKKSCEVSELCAQGRRSSRYNRQLLAVEPHALSARSSVTVVV